MREGFAKAAGLGFSAALTMAVTGLALAAGGAPGAAGPSEEAGERLGETIRRAIRAEGPFLTAEERAVIERKCGYTAGEWDGFEMNMSDGVFICENGRRVDDAETRALLAKAGPRIGRRVEAVMARAEVKAAIDRVAEEAKREALAAVDEAKIAREAAREAESAAREAVAEARRSVEEAQRARR